MTKKSDINTIHEIEKYYFGEDAFSKKHIQFLLDSSRSSIDTFRIKDEIIGYIIIVKFNSICLIHSLAVVHEYKGMGTGKKIMDLLELKCLVNGIKSIILAVKPSNYKAYALYKKMGYVPYGTKKNYYEDGSSAVLMKKDLYA